MAGSGTAAWIPKRPEELPASSGPRFSRPVTEGARATLGTRHGRSTRPFRFGSEDRPDPDPPLEPGELVGERYRIVGLLGEGGMGRVYEAEHTVLQRRVALKLLRRDAQERPENLARFRQEALAASRIGTPQIVEVVDFASHTGPAGTQTYMVMELLAGDSLEDWMDRGATLDHGVELLAQLCDGLAAAHRAGVIHRDIKPANVFCQAPDPTETRAGARIRVKILDFGIAKMTAGGQGFQTQQGSLLGTPYYLAPERVMGAKLTAAADVYSVGVILYEMLTGNVPFVAESFMGILARHVHTEPLDPRQAAPGRPIPDAIASSCMQLLAKQPEDRPTAEALAAALRELLERDREVLARVTIGLGEDLAGPGLDTKVLSEQPAEASLAERATAPPVMQGFSESSGERRAAIAGPGPGPGPGRARSGTSIGHAAVGTLAQTSSVATSMPERSSVARPTPARPRIRAPAIAVGVGVLALGVVGVIVGLRSGFGAADQGEPALGPAALERQAPAATDPVDDLPAPQPIEPSLGPAAPPPVPADASSREVREPADAPLESASPKDRETPEKPADKPKQTHTKKDPEPEPEQEDPEKPPPSEPEPAKPDPGLPTIKDDVYD